MALGIALYVCMSMDGITMAVGVTVNQKLGKGAGQDEGQK